MPDKPEQKPESEKPAKPARHTNVPLMAIIGIVLLLNLVIVGKIFMGGKSGQGSQGQAPRPAVEEVGKKMALDEFLVNLIGNGNEHYLKTTIALGLRKGIDEKEMESELAPIKDAIISVLSSSSKDEISTELGKEKLKAQIKLRVNKELRGEKVVKVYFTAFATQ